MSDTKNCTKCGVAKPMTAFYAQRDGRRGERMSQCKACHNAKAAEWARNNRDKRAATMRAYRKRHPERRRDYALRRNFGITLADYNALLDAQGGRCAICRSAQSRGAGSFHVDHDHARGVVRALLCFPCNAGLGNFSDNPVRLSRAIDYLNVHRGEVAI